MGKTYKVVMVRNGESEWNKINLFCGWYDSTISETGKERARTAGKALKDAGYKIDIAHTSVLSRARRTLTYILREIGQKDILIEKTWRLNARHYGRLTSMYKPNIAVRYGKAQVAIWRRSFDVPPPPMEQEHPFYRDIVEDPRYASGPAPNDFPMYESMELTIARTLPYWNDVIVPQIKDGKQILIVAHQDSLKGIIKHLDHDELKPVQNGSLQFLGDEKTVKKAMAFVLVKGKRNKTDNMKRINANADISHITSFE